MTFDPASRIDRFKICIGENQRYACTRNVTENAVEKTRILSILIDRYMRAYFKASVSDRCVIASHKMDTVMCNQM